MTTPNADVLTYSEAKARLEAVWPGGMLACYSDDPAERVPLLTVESALAVLFPPVLGSDAAVAVGRFKPDGPDGYRAKSLPAGPLRATRKEAEEDERAARLRSA